MSHLMKSHQPGLPLPNVTTKPPPKRLTELPQSEVKRNAGDHVAHNKLETCLRLPTFIQTKIPESCLKGTCPALESGLHTGKKRIKSLSTSPRNATGMLEKASGIKSCRTTPNVIAIEGHKKLPPKKKLERKDARPKLRLSAAADATFEMQKDEQKVVVDHVDDGAGSGDVREHLHVSKNDCGDWETNGRGRNEETIDSTFLVSFSLVEQDADLLKSLDAVQSNLSKRCVNPDWSDATFQVESGLAELEGKAQHALGLTYASLTDDDKVELEVLPKSKIDYYKTCYDVSLPSARASFTNLLNSGLNPVVESVIDHQPLCNMNKQQKMNEGVLVCGGKTERSFSTNQTASEQSNCHQRGKGNNRSMVCCENVKLDSGVTGSQSSMPSPSKGMSKPSTDSALELNLTFLHTSTPKALAGNVSWIPGGRLQAHTRSKVLSGRQSKCTKSKAAREVGFSDALLDNSSQKFDPSCRSTSSAGNARRNLKHDRKSATRNLNILTCNEKQNKLVKNNDVFSTNLLLLSSGCEQSGLEVNTVEKPSPVQIPREFTSGEDVLDESVECKSSSSETLDELEFEVFENEDFRMKPKDAELGSYPQNFCNQRHRSIIDFNEENMASFFLADVVNLTHLCRMSYSADSVNAGKQSEASPGHLQKSFSSPDKFSDLSFARLPIFGAELMLKAEGNSNLNVEQHFKESHRAHAFVSRTASEISVGLNDLVEDLKKFDVFLPSAGWLMFTTCKQCI